MASSMNFCIDKIDGDLETGNDFWGILVNYQISKYGLGLMLSGCQQEVVTGDNVLWAVIPGPYGTGCLLLEGDAWGSYGEGGCEDYGHRYRWKKWGGGAERDD